jgi:hypothetical protein
MICLKIDLLPLKSIFLVEKIDLIFCVIKIKMYYLNKVVAILKRNYVYDKGEWICLTNLPRSQNKEKKYFLVSINHFDKSVLLIDKLVNEFYWESSSLPLSKEKYILKLNTCSFYTPDVVYVKDVNNIVNLIHDKMIFIADLFLVEVKGPLPNHSLECLLSGGDILELENKKRELEDKKRQLLKEEEDLMMKREMYEKELMLSFL